MITGVGIFGLLLGLLSFMFATRRRTRLRIGVFTFLYLLHVSAAVAYFQLVQTSVADTWLYYFDPYGIYEEQGFGSNTILIVWLVQFPKSYIGGTYLDYFLVFQAVGFFGLAALMRVFEEVYEEMEVDQPFYSYLVLAMPSIHYWTSAIGKDSLFFFGLCITFWAAMNYKRRYIVLGVGMLIMLAIRPHIAVVAGAAFTLTILIDRNTRMLIKAPLFAAGLALTVFAALSLRSTFGIDVTNVDVFSDVLAGRDALAHYGGCRAHSGFGIVLLPAPQPAVPAVLLRRARLVRACRIGGEPVRAGIHRRPGGFQPDAAHLVPARSLHTLRTGGDDHDHLCAGARLLQCWARNPPEGHDDPAGHPGAARDHPCISAGAADRAGAGANGCRPSQLGLTIARHGIGDSCCEEWEFVRC
jgi:hypothetical protein